jgi:hypothetical protein
MTTAHAVEHTLDCALADPTTRDACRGECRGPEPTYTSVLVRTVTWHRVPVPEHAQHSPEAAEDYAAARMCALPVAEQDTYALADADTSEYTAQKGP